MWLGYPNFVKNVRRSHWPWIPPNTLIGASSRTIAGSALWCFDFICEASEQFRCHEIERLVFPLASTPGGFHPWSPPCSSLQHFSTARARVESLHTSSHWRYGCAALTEGMYLCSRLVFEFLLALSLYSSVNFSSILSCGIILCEWYSSDVVETRKCEMMKFSPLPTPRTSDRRALPSENRHGVSPSERHLLYENYVETNWNPRLFWEKHSTTLTESTIRFCSKILLVKISYMNCLIGSSASSGDPFEDFFQSFVTRVDEFSPRFWAFYRRLRL